MFYSKSNNSFYTAEIHGARILKAPDPAWQRPIINGMPDQAAAHPLIEVNNPACLMPADAVEITLEQHAQLLAAQSEGKHIKADAQGRPIAAEPPPDSPEVAAAKLEASLTDAVQQHLDATAQSLGYDDIRSAASYADEPAVAKYQTEGKALRAWRSLVWAAAYAKMQRIKTGLEPVPTSEVLIASLPAFTPP